MISNATDLGPLASTNNSYQKQGLLLEPEGLSPILFFDIFVEILSFSNFNVLDQCRIVCQKFKEVIESPVFARYLYEHNNMSLPGDETEEQNEFFYLQRISDWRIIDRLSATSAATVHLVIIHYMTKNVCDWVYINVKDNEPYASIRHLKMLIVKRKCLKLENRVLTLKNVMLTENNRICTDSMSLYRRNGYTGKKNSYLHFHIFPI